MTPDPPAESLLVEPTRRWLRAVWLLAGILIPQAVLYGPSLIGDRVLLPLDLLEQPGTYLPVTAEARATPPQNSILTDQVIAIELRRQFATAEVRAGRLPLWNPHTYCGSPFVGANNTAVFSPFRLPDYLAPAPITIAWVAVLRALVAGVGAFWFFRVALRVSYWPAAVGAWAFPLCGFLQIWLGYPPSHVVVWLPWLLLAIDRAVARPTGLGGVAVALVTALALVSGHAATAGHVLLASGLWLLWRVGSTHGVKPGRPGLIALAVVAAGWVLGILLSGPQTIPTIEYLASSFRVGTRDVGVVETTSQGWDALPQLVLPYFQGHSHDGCLYLLPSNRLEHAASGYAGLVTALVLAPLAWCRPDRRANWLWVALAVVGLTQVLALPGLAQLFELSPLRLLRNNRFVFVTGFAILALAVLGFDALARGQVRKRGWFFVLVVVLAALGIACFARAGTLPETIGNQLAAKLRNPQLPGPMPPAHLRTAEAIAGLQSRYVTLFVLGGITCLGAIGLWLLLWFRTGAIKLLALTLGAATMLELLANSFGINPQTDPALYYPRLPVLEQLARQAPGRVVGNLCLPPNLAQTHGLRDIRGYDGSDPEHLVRLLDAAKHPQSPEPPPYARTQSFVPRPSPILRMLGVRYVIDRGQPPPGQRVVVQGDDHYVTELPALPRAFVPRTVRSLPDLEQQLGAVTQASFDPAAVAWVDGAVAYSQCSGSARITDEIPSRVTIDVDMQTPGLVVLADLWFAGWNAYLDGEPVPVHRANYGLKAAAVPAGSGTLVFRYEPPSFTLGMWLFAIGAALTVAWGGFAHMRR